MDLEERASKDLTEALCWFCCTKSANKGRTSSYSPCNFCKAYLQIERALDQFKSNLIASPAKLSFKIPYKFFKQRGESLVGVFSVKIALSKSKVTSKWDFADLNSLIFHKDKNVNMLVPKIRSVKREFSFICKERL